jgi:hypothetical protein
MQIVMIELIFVLLYQDLGSVQQGVIKPLLHLILHDTKVNLIDFLLNNVKIL